MALKGEKPLSCSAEEGYDEALPSGGRRLFISDYSALETNSVNGRFDDDGNQLTRTMLVPGGGVEPYRNFELTSDVGVVRLVLH